ncbi:DinB family protein [Staphylococcus succinus]|uniref:Damage-inducible protein DinB n=1 Tax=Staphylococcus succinus TaxID=61015 RepID=A0ABX5ILM5_9STAP|nr:MULTISPECIES: bacillithiol transferase BstA [Staphylococcus]MBU0439183.1 bacillithiol transferase BstA [Staphylococcus succinus]MDH9162336.1 bacillithiol transferase BstA [Staphylococcus succinus]MEB7463382.1 bacillithiol transferase BstA [Staphylococcus succinus]MEB8125510.1 bacillithiol transferase BstA [Staphylococcus succinus]OIJ29308.1 damage-inducible protein DinB [Staphylococcus sp. LCT-H4]
MTNKSVYEVIDSGINYIITGYDNWNNEQVLDDKIDAFPNTIHWQYGHVLTIFETVLSLCEQNEVDVAKYTKLFGYGSSPDKWGDADIPSVDEIFTHLKTLGERARKLTDQQLEAELTETIAGCSTLDELLVLNAIHIPIHAGKIEEMSRLLRQQQ